MKDLLDTLAAWRADGVEVGRAVVIRTYGSAPRQEGATMLAASDGRLAGSVSGGCVEGAALEEIARARATGRSRVIRYGISDERAWDVGLACGGTIDVLVEPGVDAVVERAARDAATPGGRGTAVITPLPEGDAAPPEPRLVVRDDGSIAAGTGDAGTGDAGTEDAGTGDAGTGDAAGEPLAALRPLPQLAALAAEARDCLLRGTSRTIELGGRAYFVEAFAVRPRLVVVGAVQVAVPLVRIAHVMGYETVVVDPRAAFANAERFPDADAMFVGWLDDLADSIGLAATDAVAVLAHDPKVDDPSIAVAFARGCRYVGAIGSRKTQAARRERLGTLGVSADDLDRLHGPIGLDLGGRSPEETALAIMAEIVADRFGRARAPLGVAAPATPRPAPAPSDPQAV